MAEIFGVVTGGAGLLSLSYQIGECAVKLRNLVKSLQNAPRSLERSTSEIEVFAQILRQMEQDRVSHNDHPSTLLHRCLLLCQQSTEEINELTQNLEQAMKRSRLGGKFMFVLREGELNKLCGDLEREKSSLMTAYGLYLEQIREARHDLLFGHISRTESMVYLLASNNSDKSSCTLTPSPPNAATHSVMRADEGDRGQSSNSEQNALRSRPRLKAKRVSRLQEKSTTRFRLALPAWLCNKVWEVTAHSAQSGWTVNIRTFNVRPHDASIFQACNRGSVGDVKQLIANGEASLQDVTPYGWTLLQLTCKSSYLRDKSRRHLALLRFLLDNLPSYETTGHYFDSSGRLESLSVSASQLKLFVVEYQMCFDDVFREDFCELICDDYHSNRMFHFIAKSLSHKPDELSVAQRLTFIARLNSTDFLDRRGIRAQLLEALYMNDIKVELATAMCDDGFNVLHFVAEHMGLRDPPQEDDLELLVELVNLGASLEAEFIHQTPLKTYLKVLFDFDEPETVLVNFRRWISAIERTGRDLIAYGEHENEVLSLLKIRFQQHQGWFSAKGVLFEIHYGERASDWDVNVGVLRTMKLYKLASAAPALPGAWPHMVPTLISWTPSFHEEFEEWEVFRKVDIVRRLVTLSEVAEEPATICECKNVLENTQDDHCVRSRTASRRCRPDAARPRSSSQTPPFSFLKSHFHEHDGDFEKIVYFRNPVTFSWQQLTKTKIYRSLGLEFDEIEGDDKDDEDDGDGFIQRIVRACYLGISLERYDFEEILDDLEDFRSSNPDIFKD